jgi:hypothetical protein
VQRLFEMAVCDSLDYQECVPGASRRLPSQVRTSPPEARCEADVLEGSAVDEGFLR